MPVDSSALAIVLARSLGPMLASFYEYLGKRDPHTRSAPMQIILTVAEAPKGLPAIQKKVNLSYNEFAEVLDALVVANVVKVSGKPGDEVVGLSAATEEAIRAYGAAAGA